MFLTREEAIEKHRAMWYWIHDETLKQKRIVEENEYFLINNIDDTPEGCSYLCEYVSINGDSCNACPVKFVDNIINVKPLYCLLYKDSPYIKWNAVQYNYNSENYKNYKLAAEFAKQIAELPEK